MLRQLGENTQVLCITHLPQVAAWGHHHFKVTKTIAKKTTRTEITRLNSQARQLELARMLGSETVTEQSLKHAEEMLELARFLVYFQ